MKGAPIGLVLSGGGARGAYEVGVLNHIAKHLPELLERITVVTGTSVGAVNAVHLASHGMTRDAVARLVALWSNLRIDELISVAPFAALRMVGAAPLRFMRKGVSSPATGLLRADRLWKLISREIDWGGLDAYIRKGRFDAVAVAGTDIRSGATHLFTQGRVVASAAGVQPTSDFVLTPARLNLRHVLASAAIPLLFPPIQIRGRWYMDGGVRHNTPLSPALRLGAKSLLILSVRGSQKEDTDGHAFPGIGQVVGKLFDSVFLDRMAYDLDRMQRINDVVEAAEQLGTDEGARFHDALKRRGRPNYRRVQFASLHPTEDLGLIAAQAIRASKNIPTMSFVRVLSALFEDDARASGDAASFLLFDGSFTRKLLEIGERDAATAHESLKAL